MGGEPQKSDAPNPESVIDSAPVSEGKMQGAPEVGLSPPAGKLNQQENQTPPAPPISNAPAQPIINVIASPSQEHWIWKFAPILPTLVVTAAGFWIVDYLARRRQTRDEIFKTCDLAHKEVAEISEAAVAAWSKPGNDPDIKSATAELIMRVHRLGILFTALSRRNQEFKELLNLLVAFRMAVTNDLDDGDRKPDLTRQGGIMVAASALHLEADEAFNRVYQ